MKNILATIVIAIIGSASGFAEPFTPGNAVVYRVGDGAAALTNASTAVFLDEFDPTGALVQSIPFPTTAGDPPPLTAAGTATAEGMLQFSSDGALLAVPGYSAAAGIASIATSTAAAVPRAIALVGSDGLLHSYTTLGTTGFSGGNIRSGITDGTDIWAIGSNTGVVTAPVGGTSSTSVSNTATNLRTVNIFNGQLYISSAAGTIRVGAVGTGTPITSGETITPLAGFPTNQGISQFFFANLSGGSGVDTLYVANQTAPVNVSKYSLVSDSWTLNNSVTIPAMPLGLAGQSAGTAVTMFVTTAANLYSLTDNSGYNHDIDGTLSSSLAAAGTNKAFRGVVIVVGGQGPIPAGAVSRKTHGGAGTFDVSLPLSGTPGIECRTGGATSDYTVVVTFGSPVTVTGNPQAQITSGTATVGSNGNPNGGAVTISGNDVIVPLTNVANAQRIQIQLNGVTGVAGSGNVTVPMSVLAGDTNANGAVNSADVSQTKGRLGATLDPSNFRSDVNANGAVNSADVSQIKTLLGTGLP